MNILITGGNGYIGTYLVDYFRRLGYVVWKTSRYGVSPDTRIMNLLITESIRGTCAGMDIVVHTANYDERMIPGNEREAFLANSLAIGELYIDAVRHGVSQFIYFSTFHVYGETSGIITERTECNPVSAYGLTHLFAEQYLKHLSLKYDVPIAVVRLTNGIGLPPPGCDKWYLIVNDCCRSCVMNQKIILRSSGIQKRDFVPILDVCHAIEDLLLYGQKKPYAIYNISYQKSYSIRQIAGMVAESYQKLTGKSVECVIATSQKDTERELFVSSEKIRKLGWDTCLTVPFVIDEILQHLLSVDGNAGGLDERRPL